MTCGPSQRNPTLGANEARPACVMDGLSQAPEGGPAATGTSTAELTSEEIAAAAALLAREQNLATSGFT